MDSEPQLVRATRDNAFVIELISLELSLALFITEDRDSMDETTNVSLLLPSSLIILSEGLSFSKFCITAVFFSFQIHQL